jgi:hypothetical protein
MAAVPKRVEARIRDGVRRYQKILIAARDRDINESDTVTIITDFLADTLGYDKYSEITSEFAIRGTYCDLAIKIDGRVEFLIECKAVGVSLKEAHLRQAMNYAAQHGIDWVILTNGIDWRVFKLVIAKPIEMQPVFQMDLTAVDARQADTVQRFFSLSKEGLAKSAIAALQVEQAALSPALVSAVLCSEPVLRVIRRELRRSSEGGVLVDQDDLCRVLREAVIKRELVEGDDAKSAASRVKRAIAGKVARRKRRAAKGSEGSGGTGATTSDSEE